MSACERIDFHLKSNQELDDKQVHELFDIALEARGESGNELMRQLPRDKKIILIRQIVVKKINCNKSLNYIGTSGIRSTKRN